ncbi:hypothetical protein [Flavobacterium sp.]|uniref:beta strand repeat-containing protein n=1 Tax=Flavobacterium sp. TaxID=239 RepID=UPI0025F1A497|nr:hypothetical protein [Flavobacterium sp.]
MKKETTYFLTILTFFGFFFSASGQSNNTFSGENSGVNNIGSFNTGFGINSLKNNTSNSNSAFGIGTLSDNTGGYNCAFGNGSMAANGSGTLNNAYGTRSLANNTTGSRNIAIGHRTLEANIDGFNNTAIGYASLHLNSGNSNIAMGCSTPRNLVSGSGNIFLGTQSAINLLQGNYNVFLGNLITMQNVPSTPLLAGNDTSKTVIIADGAGFQRIFISKNGNTGIGLGNNVIPVNRLDVKGGVVIGKNFTPDGIDPGEIAPSSGLLVEGKVGIGTVMPNNKLEITQGTNGNSGLRFTNLTSNYNAVSVQPTNKFLSVNATGDVVLQKMANVVDTNILSSNANLMNSNVNNINSQAKIINSISNTITTDNQLITTVNGVASSPVNLPMPSFVDVPQILIQSEGGVITLSNGGGSFTLPTFTDVFQTISQAGNTITLSNGGGSFTLPTFIDTDQQSLTLTGNTLAISNGNSVTLPTYTATPQTISQAGNTVTLSNGGGSFTLPTFTDTDQQSLTLTGNTLAISNGNSVTLPTYTATPQTISQAGNTITLSNGGGSFTLPTFTDTDQQSLTLTGNTLAISNGNNVTLPATNVISGNSNITVTGDGSAALPFQISSIDNSLYSNNGVINQATTISGNRIVDMNNSNIWFTTSNSTSNGKIYIGADATFPNTTGNYKLFVEGGILTEKVKVALRSTANWADYVFEKNYGLMPLKNVEEYITNNKHLPGIDSATELAKNGLDLAEMQAKHMAKIEELTLYIIQQNKAIEQNNKDIQDLKLKVQKLTANDD